jgi:hypothetical protein
MYYLHRVNKHILATPTDVDNEAWDLLLQLIDPSRRKPEMTRAMARLMDTIKYETRETDTSLDDGIDLVLRQLLEL